MPHQPRHRRSQAGQASLEYAALLAVLAVVLVLAGAVTGTGAITNAVSQTIARGLCLVGGGDCYATERHACTTSSSSTSGRLGVQLTFLRLGGRFGLLREQRSDGTVTLTLTEGVDAAPTAGVGAEAEVATGHARAGAGATLATEAGVDLSHQRQWQVADAAAADRLQHTIERWAAVQAAAHATPASSLITGVVGHLPGVHLPRLPRADNVGLKVGAKGTISLAFAGAPVLAAGIEVSAGGTRDRRTGRTTLSLALKGNASATLAGVLAGTGLTLTGNAGAQVIFDRGNAPIDLAVTLSGTPRPGVAAGLGEAAAGERPLAATASTVAQETFHLDLTQPDNRAVYDRLVASLRPWSRDQAEAVLAVAAQLRAAGRIDRTTYRTDEVTYGAGGEVAAGARVGVEASVTRQSMSLTGAWTRPAGGVWEQRDDCVARA